MSALLQLRNVGISRQDRRLLDGITLDLWPGSVTALVGPNGAGKSTLLAVAAGDLPVESGQVLLQGRDIAHWPVRALARARAVMPQDHAVHFAFSVREVVAMGRLPHASDPGRDAALVEAAIAAADIAHLGDRDMQRLSGGETARVAFARVLAQDTPLMLLDEPTAALDLAHQERLLAEVRKRARRGAAALVVLHDLNLAAGHADRIVMLREGRVVAMGRPHEVFTAAAIETVYGQPVAILPHPSRDAPLIATLDRPGDT